MWEGVSSACSRWETGSCPLHGFAFSCHGLDLTRDRYLFDMTVSLVLDPEWVVLSGVVRGEESGCVSAIHLLGALCFS